ncbi:MAG: metalloregulator ArsR/SmtB family transcription factor [Xanthomonadales bacterium]|nr:metalloregulator ArsR/SmtB family transcription factor [Xanthomonadales bacterium]
MVTYNVFDAISDPTRRAILDSMRVGEVGAGELADRFPVSRPAISRHVRILRKAGLVRQRKEAQRRFYSLRPEALAEVDRWLAPYRLFWSARMVDLKHAAEALSAAEHKKE